MQKPTIGWIGLGLMGNAMSQQLLKAGYPLTVYNRHREKEEAIKNMGAETATTPRDLLQKTDVIIIMVTDDKAIREIFEGDQGLLGTDDQQKIIINMSTVSPAISKEMAERCQVSGSHYIDAPVSGSILQATAAQLLIMAGGDAMILEQVRPVLETMGKMVIHVGNAGAGNAAKLAVNMLLGIFTQGFSEAMILAEQNAIAPKIFLELLLNSPMSNPYIRIKGEAIINNNFKASFSLNNIVKDLRLAQDLGSDTPLADITLKTFEAASIQYGDDDLISVYSFLKMQA